MIPISVQFKGRLISNSKYENFAQTNKDHSNGVNIQHISPHVIINSVLSEISVKHIML